MNTHHIEIALTENGKITLQNLPFKKGDRVKIIIFQKNRFKVDSNFYPLQGKVIRYDAPFEPATEDWEAIQ